MRAVRVAVAYTIRIRVGQVVLMVGADTPALSSNARCDKTAAVDGCGLQHEREEVIEVVDTGGMGLEGCWGLGTLPS